MGMEIRKKLQSFGFQSFEKLAVGKTFLEIGTGDLKLGFGCNPNRRLIG
jgi:hypothetical protein